MDQDLDRPQPDQPAHRPRSRQRSRVFGLVREIGGAVDVTTLADRTGLHVTTVRFHLDALCADGLVARTRINRPGVGRPRTGYVAVQGRMDYRSVVEVLALELGDTVSERQRRAQSAGRRWAARILTEQPTAADVDEDTDPLESRTTMAADLFEQMGFAPEIVPSAGRQRTIRLSGCPVRELAHEFPEVSCGIHLGLLQGLTAAGTTATTTPTGAAQSVLRAELEPFVTPELCVARVIADD